MIVYSHELACLILDEIKKLMDQYTSDNVQEVTFTGSTVQCGDRSPLVVTRKDESSGVIAAGGNVAIAAASIFLAFLLLLCCCMRRRGADDEADEMGKHELESIIIGTDDASHDTPRDTSKELSKSFLYDEGGVLYGIEDDSLDELPNGGRILRDHNYLGDNELERYEHTLDVHRCNSSFCMQCVSNKETTFISTRRNGGNKCQPATIRDSPGDMTPKTFNTDF